MAFGVFMLLFIFWAVSSSPVSASTIIKTLPGFSGDLPFTFQTGYVGVGEAEQVQLFYYFVESERRPLQDPLVLWIPGGPGCSSLASFFFESGPLTFNTVSYAGGLPSLHLNPNTWTKGLNIIYLDAPVGTGFSYSKTTQGYNIGDFGFVAHTHEFLQKWLKKHPKFLDHHIYIAGEGYSGNPIPILVQNILKDNESGHKPHINLKGYVIGNPGTDVYTDFNSRVPFAHQSSLLPNELYESANANCNGDFVAVNRSKQCASDMDAITKLISQINIAQILEPSCSNVFPNDLNFTKNFLREKFRGFLCSQPNDPALWCRSYNHMFSHIWANDENVQETLHVRKGAKSFWEYCNDTLGHMYSHDVSSVVDVHRNLSKTHLRVLLYSGDHDMAIPHIGTQKWIKSLNLTLNEAWRPWSVDNQIAGYTMRFVNDEFSLTFATVKGAGHFAAEHKVKECSSMVHRWMSYGPL